MAANVCYCFCLAETFGLNVCVDFQLELLAAIGHTMPHQANKYAIDLVAFLCTENARYSAENTRVLISLLLRLPTAVIHCKWEEVSKSDHVTSAGQTGSLFCAVLVWKTVNCRGSIKDVFL